MESVCLRPPMINKRGECWSIVGWRRPADQLNEREKSCLPNTRCVPLVIAHPPKVDPMSPKLQRCKLLQTNKQIITYGGYVFKKNTKFITPATFIITRCSMT